MQLLLGSVDGFALSLLSWCGFSRVRMLVALSFSSRFFYASFRIVFSLSSDARAIVSRVSFWFQYLNEVCTDFLTGAKKSYEIVFGWLIKSHRVDLHISPKSFLFIFGDFLRKPKEIQLKAIKKRNKNSSKNGCAVVKSELIRKKKQQKSPEQTESAKRYWSACVYLPRQWCPKVNKLLWWKHDGN